MIRRDYILRQVQELAQRLACALMLRTRGDAAAALQEVGNALRSVDASVDPDGADPERWISLCRQQGETSGPLMMVVAGLLEERAVGLAGIGRTTDGERLRMCGAVLRLEAILSGAVPVTRELLDAVSSAIAEVPTSVLVPAAWSRLLSFHVQRGRWSEAEDCLFEWAESRDAGAVAAGRAFYAELERQSDAALEAGGFSRAEVTQGRADLERWA
jgi:hypothetical protein